jgi:hypothetical protein
MRRRGDNAPANMWRSVIRAAWACCRVGMVVVKLECKSEYRSAAQSAVRPVSSPQGSTFSYEAPVCSLACNTAWGGQP